MGEYDTILLNETHIPNNPLRVDIVDEVNDLSFASTDFQR